MARLYDNEAVLDAATPITLENAREFNVRSGSIEVGVTVDDGAGGDPSDSPESKEWTLWTKPDDGVSSYRQVGSGDALVEAELAKIAPNGNNVVTGKAVIHGLIPGTKAKLLLSAGTGGDGDSRLTMDVAS